MKAFMVCFAVVAFTHQQQLHAQWTKQNSPVTQKLLSVQFISPTTGYIAGEVGVALKTTDGGTSWNKLTLAGSPAAFQVVRFVNDTGYLFGNGPTLLRTTNGGTTWTPLSITLPGSAAGIVYSGYLFDGKNAVICGHYVGPSFTLKAFIAQTSNAGASWQVQAHDSITAFFSITFTDPLTGYVVGHTNSKQGPILKTTDGGITWFNQKNPNEFSSLKSVFFVNATTGYVGGTSPGTILMTTNAGETWLERTSIGGALDISLFALNAGTIYAVSDELKIYQTSDSGKTWIPQYENFSQEMHSIFFRDEQTGFAVGDSGYILRTTNGGATSVNDFSSIADGYGLEQNFPNPFNPSTTITYQLPEKQFVLISIFDLLGREVATVKNEVQEAGRHTIDWDAKNFSSGTYLLRMQAGSFSQTRRILLLK